MRRARGERGAIGGVEVLPLGVLVFVGGLMLAANAWAVVDARLMAATAAREAVRAFVEAPDGNRAQRAGAAAAHSSAAAHGTDPADLVVDWQLEGPGFGRCARVAATVRYEVAAFALPAASFPIAATATELVDPHRDGLPGSGCGT